MRIRNPLIKRLLIILFVTIASTVILFFAIRIVINSKAQLAYDVGEKDGSVLYEDIILKSYDEYQELVNKYKISSDLTALDFQNNYYLASFQDYDSCSETKFKQVESVSIDGAINVTFKIYNKCGWCRAHKTIHLIKLDKFEGDFSINYSYVYNKELNCSAK